MWIFELIPELFIHITFFFGVIGVILGFLLSFIPFVNTYKLPIQVISILILSLGLYLEGGLSNNKEWQFKANELKAKISSMEAKMAKNDAKQVEKASAKIQTAKQTHNEILKYIDQEATKYDGKFKSGKECQLPDVFFRSYNNSLGKETK